MLNIEFMQHPDVRSGPCIGSVTPGTVWIQTRSPDNRATWLWGRNPRRIIAVYTLDGIQEGLATVEKEARSGNVAVGFLAYEAAPAFDPAFSCHPPPARLPLLWFAVYDRLEEKLFPVVPSLTGPDFRWEPSLDETAYTRDIAHIKQAIAAGETYQVNHTFRLESSFSGDPLGLFARMLSSQPLGYAAYLDTGDHVVASLSPELFFEKRANQIVCRPMKGTAKRGRTTREDEQRANWLHTSEKNRAENVMIVDMVRNDLGRIAHPGTVQITNPFAIESYPTLFQMTTTVEATSDASLPELFSALFPCASVTGAPKVETMRIIHDLETTPRGLYTGSIGRVGPGDVAQFNVGIRTLHVDRADDRAIYGTGSGIVWDSNSFEEYRECAAKALILCNPLPPVTLLASMRWDPGIGIRLWDQQKERLKDSASYFGIPWSTPSFVHYIEKRMAGLPEWSHSIRCWIDPVGNVTSEIASMDGHPPFAENTEDAEIVWQAGLARCPTDENNRFLFHKTTQRDVYDIAKADWPSCQDVILWNFKGHVMETGRGNVVIRKNGDLITPPVNQGLLNGTFRRKLLQDNSIKEGVLDITTLKVAEAVYMINAVRGWVKLEILFT